MESNHQTNHDLDYPKEGGKIPYAQKVIYERHERTVFHEWLNSLRLVGGEFHSSYPN